MAPATATILTQCRRLVKSPPLPWHGLFVLSNSVASALFGNIVFLSLAWHEQPLPHYMNGGFSAISYPKLLENP